MNEQAPPRRLENIVALLTPPARREEVLGDLYERYKSPAQYVADAALTVPLVVASQIRRMADPAVVLLEALALYFSFFAGDGRAGAAGFLQQPQVLRILVQVIAGLIGLRLADAYITSRSAQQATLRAAIGASAACLAQSALSTARPDLALSAWALFRDAVFAVATVSMMQIAFSASGGLTPAAAGGKRRRPEEPARQKNAAFDTHSRARSLWGYFAAAAFVFLAFSLIFAESQNRGVRMGAALILFAGLWRVLNRPRTGSSTKPMN
ncbi:MAG TPA: hypothetical protein VHX36_05480 [Candidatus Acidoferrales bacterium]|nr:hypothetical protein [Candidatus Acidoferrales bacterium]